MLCNCAFRIFGYTRSGAYQVQDCVLTFRVIHGSAPRYLGTFKRIANRPNRYSLRSAATNHLLVPPFRLSTVGSRAFPVAGPQIWNDLPDEVTSAQSLSIFRQRLKSYLFRLSYPDLII
jgi:hypothetical protein